MTTQRSPIIVINSLVSSGIMLDTIDLMRSMSFVVLLISSPVLNSLKKSISKFKRFATIFSRNLLIVSCPIYAVK